MLAQAVRAAGRSATGAAWQPGPLDRTLALLDSLLWCAELVVEGDNARGRPR